MSYSKMGKNIILNLILSMFLIMGIANSTIFYDNLQFSFEKENVDSIHFQSFNCQDTDCSKIATSNAIFYKGDSVGCWNNYTITKTLSEAQFLACMTRYQITDDIFSTSDEDILNGQNTLNVMVRYDTNTESVGYLNYFFTNGDTYLPSYDKTNINFNQEVETKCSNAQGVPYDYCWETETSTMPFLKKNNATAEIGSLTPVNLKDPTKPVQINVSVQFNETICSAYRLEHPEFYRPTYIRAGYSDFSSQTQVKLTITKDSDNMLLFSQIQSISIPADTCAALTLFTWPANQISSDLQGETVTFLARTDVTDGQVSNSIPDYFSRTEMIYPTNLENACWTKSNTFILSNTESTTWTPSVAQITKGESLYAIFDAGAYRYNNNTPMGYTAQILFNNQAQTIPMPYIGEDELKYATVNLTNIITGLSAGTHTVSLILTPSGNDCEITNITTQIQTLNILEPNRFSITFHIDSQETFNPLENVNVNLQLIAADDYTGVTYTNNTQTDINGDTTFTNLVSGWYRYTITNEGYSTLTSVRHFTRNEVINLMLTNTQTNEAPGILLPSTYVVFINDTLTIDLESDRLAWDINDGLENTNITYQITSGNLSITQQGSLFTITSALNTENSATLRITITDPHGASASDTTTITFISNQEPQITLFGLRTQNTGNTPFTPEFEYIVTDNENDPMTCTINFGDSPTNEVINNCNGYGTFNHQYNTPGTYNVTFNVNDAYHQEAITRSLLIYVTQIGPTPVFNEPFTYTSSNGDTLPTDITFNWEVSHNMNYPMTCTIIVNGITIATPDCTDGTYTLNNFNTTGNSIFEFIVTDNATNMLREVIEHSFYNPNEINLEKLNTQLIVNPVIEPGEFQFSIATTNETLMERKISIEPQIICDGVTNTLDALTKQLTTSAISINTISEAQFDFLINTQDFALIIPTDTDCQFKIILTDNYGSKLELTKDITFSYTQEEAKMTSIRGKGTDIVNYMSSTISNSLTTGYNTVDFKVVNNEAKQKELTIGMISQPLNIDYKTVISLGSGEEKRVSIPIYISEKTQKGSYPVRYTVRDEQDTQTRYTQIIIQ